MNRRRAWHTVAGVDAVWDHRDVLRRGWLILGAAASGMAWSLLGSAPARMAGPSFGVIREYGGPAVWGIAFALLGAGLLAGRVLALSLVRWSFLYGGVLYLLWAISLAEAVRTEPQVPYTGPIVYLAIAALHVSHALDYRAEEPRAPLELGDSP